LGYICGLTIRLIQVTLGCCCYCFCRVSL